MLFSCLPQKRTWVPPNPGLQTSSAMSSWGSPSIPSGRPEGSGVSLPPPPGSPLRSREQPGHWLGSGASGSPFSCLVSRPLPRGSSPPPVAVAAPEGCARVCLYVCGMCRVPGSVCTCMCEALIMCDRVCTCFSNLGVRVYTPLWVHPCAPWHKSVLLWVRGVFRLQECVWTCLCLHKCVCACVCACEMVQQRQ